MKKTMRIMSQRMLMGIIAAMALVMIVELMKKIIIIKCRRIMIGWGKRIIMKKVDMIMK